MSRFRRFYGSGPIHLLATLAGLAAIGLALVSLATPGGATPATQASASTHGGMAGMDMTGLPPPVPKLAANSACTASACPIPKPGPTELAVAGELGAAMAAAWVTPTASGLHVRLELLSPYLGPLADPIRVAGDPPREACGPGCWMLTLRGSPRSLTVTARADGHHYSVTLPLRWERGQAATARSLVNRAVASMASFIGMRLVETTATGIPGLPGSFIDVHYLLSAPDAMTAQAVGYGNREVTIGPTQWTYTPGVGWTTGTFSGDGTNDFRTADTFAWSKDEQSAALLGVTDVRGQQVAEVALMNPTVPAWLQLHIEVASGRVLEVRTITQGKFTTDRYSDYGAPQRIVPPIG